MKLKLIFVCLAIALAQITPSDAQSISPESRYTRKAPYAERVRSGYSDRHIGSGDMRVEKTGEGWRVFVRAAMSPISGGVGPKTAC